MNRVYEYVYINNTSWCTVLLPVSQRGYNKAGKGSEKGNKDDKGMEQLLYKEQLSRLRDLRDY